MPLEKAPVGSPGFGRNIETEEKAGKKPKQAEAIAFSKARGDMLEEEQSIADGEGMLAKQIMASCDALESRIDAHMHAHTSIPAGTRIKGRIHLK